MKVILLLLSLAAVTLAQTEWVALGDPKYLTDCKDKMGNSCAPYEVSVKEIHDVVCVSTTSKTGWRERVCKDDTEPHIFAAGKEIGCKKLNFADAQALCKSNGARLPTKQEAMDGCTAGSGCPFNSFHIWTAPYVPTATPTMATPKPTPKPTLATAKPTMATSKPTMATPQPQSASAQMQWCPAVHNKVADGTTMQLPGKLNYIKGSLASCKAVCDQKPGCNAVVHQTKLNRCWLRSGATGEIATSLAYREVAVKNCQPPVTWCPPVLNRVADGTTIPYSASRKYYMGTLAECQATCDKLPNCNSVIHQTSLNRCWLRTGATKVETTSLSYRQVSLKTCHGQVQAESAVQIVYQRSSYGIEQAALYFFATVSLIGTVGMGYREFRRMQKGEYESI